MASSSTSCGSLILLLGLPGCGKTTFAEKLRAVLEQQQGLVPVIISFDKFIPLEEQAAFSQQASESDEKLFKSQRTALRNGILQALADEHGSTKEVSIINECVKEHILKELKNAATANKFPILILDDNHYYRSMRYEYYQVAREFSFSFLQLGFTCSMEEVLRRNRNRKDCIAESVIKNMALKLESPNPLKHHWEGFSFQISTEGDNATSAEEVWALVKEVILFPVLPIEDHSEEAEESRKTCSQNVLHQSDNMLRKLVSNDLRSASRDQDGEKKPAVLSVKELSVCLHSCKQQILEDLRNGKIKLPDDVVNNLQEGDAHDKLSQILSKELLSRKKSLKPKEFS